MIERIKRRLIDRPLDGTVALIIFILGLGQVINHAVVFWPSLLDIIGSYFVVAGALTFLAVAYHGPKYMVHKFVVEMFGWLFIAGASFAMATIWWAAVFLVQPKPDFITLGFMYAVLSLGTLTRFLYMRRIYKGGGRSG